MKQSIKFKASKLLSLLFILNFTLFNIGTSQVISFAAPETIIDLVGSDLAMDNLCEYFDINGDSKIDFIQGKSYETSYVYMSQPDGTYMNVPITGSPSIIIGKADIDLDGDIDIMCTEGYIKNDVNQSFSYVSFGLKFKDEILLIENIDDDADLEGIAVLSGGFSSDSLVIFKDILNNRSLKTHIPGIKKFKEAYTSDIDLDGIKEIIIESPFTSFSIIKRNNNSFTSTLMDEPGWTKNATYFDYDNDGDLDFFDCDDNIRIIKNENGVFDWPFPLVYSSGSSPSYMLIEDFNKSYTEDIMAVSVRSGEVVFEFYESKGNGIFRNRIEAANLPYPPNFQTFSNASLKLAANSFDYDSDGLPDLIVQNPFENKIVWLKNTSTLSNVSPLIIQGIEVSTLVSNDIIIKQDKLEELNYQIFNQNGLLIKKGITSSKIDVSTIIKGHYILKLINSNNQSFSSGIIKM